MATKLQTTEKPTRRDVFGLSPDDVVRGRNTRLTRDTNPEYPEIVKRLAVDIAKRGQLQPAVAHRDDDNRVVLDAGETRLDAIILLRKGFETADPDNGETRTFHDPHAKLDVIVETHKLTDEDTFVRSYMENVKREDFNPIDEADAQQVLREEYKWSDVRIARESGQTNQNRVMALKKLVTAREYIRDLVRDGKLGLYVYSENLFGMSDENVKAAIDHARDPESGKIEGAKVREYLRNVLSGVPVQQPEEQQSEEKAPKGPRVPKRTVKDFNTFTENYCSDENEERNDRAVKLLQTIQRWLACDLKTDTQLIKALSEI